MEGTVKFFNEGKGFGFITADDGKDYFVHVTALPEGAKVDEGDEVTFEVEEGPRGPKAINVSLGSSGSEDADSSDSSKDAAESEDTEDSEE